MPTGGTALGISSHDEPLSYPGTTNSAPSPLTSLKQYPVNGTSRKNLFKGGKAFYRADERDATFVARIKSFLLISQLFINLLSSG